MGHWRQRHSPPRSTFPEKLEPWPRLDVAEPANDDGDVVGLGLFVAIGAMWAAGLIAVAFLAVRALEWWLAL